MLPRDDVTQVRAGPGLAPPCQGGVVSGFMRQAPWPFFLSFLPALNAHFASLPWPPKTHVRLLFTPSLLAPTGPSFLLSPLLPPVAAHAPGPAALFWLPCRP